MQADRDRIRKAIQELRIFMTLIHSQYLYVQYFDPLLMVQTQDYQFSYDSDGRR